MARPQLVEAERALSGAPGVATAMLAVVGVYGLLPLIATALYSVATVWRRRPLPDGYTLRWWIGTLTDPGFLDAVGRSVLLSVLTVLIVNIIVLPPLYWSHVRNARLRPLLYGIALIPFVLPGVVMAAGIHRFVGLFVLTAPLQATPTLLLLAFVAVSFPPYLWAVDAAMRARRITLLSEAADTLGASPLRTLAVVVIPNIRSGLAAGSLLVFASALGELALARLITGSAYETLPLWQLRQLRGTDANPNAMAVSSLLGLALLFIFSFSVILATRQHGRTLRNAVPSGTAA